MAKLNEESIFKWGLQRFADADVDDDEDFDNEELDNEDLDQEDESDNEELDDEDLDQEDDSDDEESDDEIDDAPKGKVQEKKPNKTIVTMRDQITHLSQQVQAFQKKEQEREFQQLQQQLNDAPTVKPTFESCGLDPVKFQEETEKWVKAEGQRDQQKQQWLQQKQKLDALWNAAQSRYAVGKTLIKARDYAEVEAVVETTLTNEQLGWLLVSTDEPNKVVYTAGKDAKLLAALKKADTPFKFAALVGKIEATRGETGVKTPPKPEKRVVSGGAAPSNNATRRADADIELVRRGKMTMDEYRRRNPRKKA